MHLPINSCLGEHSHEMKTAGGNVNNPFGPKLHTCRKGNRKQATKESFACLVCYVSENVTLVL